MVSLDAIAGEAVFVLFFIGLGVAYLFVDYTFIRKGFLAGFMAVILVFSLTGFSALPVVSFHKFSSPYPQEDRYHTMEVVDQSGESIYVDHRALRPMIPYNVRQLAEKIATEYSDAKARQTSCFVLNETNEYRERRLRGDDFFEYVDFPPHDIVRHWSKDDVDHISKFTGVRILEVVVISSEGGSRIVDRSEDVVYSFNSSGVSRCSP